MAHTAFKHACLHRRAASAYRRATRKGKRYSFYVNEAVEVHPEEGAALTGGCLPGGLRWRNQWHRVQEITAEWCDGRKPTLEWPGHGRTYVYVSAGPEGFFEMYYDKAWIVYRKIVIR